MFEIGYSIQTVSNLVGQVLNFILSVNFQKIAIVLLSKVAI